MFLACSFWLDFSHTFLVYFFYLLLSKVIRSFLNSWFQLNIIITEESLYLASVDSLDIISLYFNLISRQSFNVAELILNLLICKERFVIIFIFECDMPHLCTIVCFLLIHGICTFYDFYRN